MGFRRNMFWGKCVCMGCKLSTIVLAEGMVFMHKEGMEWEGGRGTRVGGGRVAMSSTVILLLAVLMGEMPAYYSSYYN